LSHCRILLAYTIVNNAYGLSSPNEPYKYEEDVMNNKKIIYVDLDDTLCDYSGAYNKVKESSPSVEFPQSQPGFYENLSPLPDAIESFEWLCEQECFDIYILTAPSIYNPLCYTEKRVWIERCLGFEHVNRLIISYHKNLLLGDYMIDDQAEGRGQELFKGELLKYGDGGFKSWRDIKLFLTKNGLNKIISER
jgi:5'(3')-deoxyribonucleotidase